MIIFVVPAYNEAENIGELLNRTREAMLNKQNMPYRVLIINDGSTDNTVDVVEALKDRMPVDIYSHYPNKGVGEAFRVGLRKALEACKDGDIIVTKEADNTSDLSILNELIGRIEGGCDVALASCYAKEGAVRGTTALRMILSKGANTLIRLVLPIKDINTYSSFYRAYSSRALKQMRNLYGDRLIEGDGFECMVELLIKLGREGRFKIAEVPMVLDVSKRVGKSKMHLLRTVGGFLKVILKEGVFYRMKSIFRRKGGGDGLR